MTAYFVIAPTADIIETPDPQLPRNANETELVFGEHFFVEEDQGEWVRGYCVHDNYKGWTLRSLLEPNPLPASHVVTAARTDAYMEPNIKSPRLRPFSFGSQIIVTGVQGNFLEIGNVAWVFTEHLKPIEETEPDYIKTALKFLETPYYWGGRSGFGIDCSGLLQVSLAHAGLSTPRDSGPQSQTVGRRIESAPIEGDLVFFRGHAGFMADDHHILHADGDHMKVVLEPLENVIQRKGQLIAVRRLD